MPPPSFSHPPATVLPRAVQTWLKDLSQKLRSALLATDEAKRHVIVSSIETAVEDQVSSISAAAQSDEGNHPAAAGPSPSAQIRTQLSLRINDNLLNLIQGEFESSQEAKLPAIVDVLYVLVPLLGSASIVMEWWDLVLRPVLKSAAIQNVTANRARQLVVRAMTSAPTTAYEDEPAPSAVWPLAGSNPSGASPRRTRDTPYPISAAAPASPSRQPPRSSSMTPGSGPGNRSASVGSRQDMYRRFTQRIFDLYLAEAAHESEQTRNEDGSLVTAGRRGRALDLNQRQSGNVVGSSTDSESLVWKGNLESILLVYSNEKPKEFFHHVSESFGDAAARVPLLFLLSTFLRLYSLHAYHITSTPLPAKMILSLQLDTSTTCVSLGVTALIMLIPHIPNWIANGGAGGLPTLLSIFARIVDWRRLGSGWENRVGDDPELQELRREKDEEFAEVDRLGKRLNIKPSLRWHRLETSFDTAVSTPPNAEYLFTFLYGLFPCNVIRFLRSPVDYLKKASFDSPFEGPWEEMMDELAVQSRSAPILRRHTLHPALITMDAENELTDKQRWLDHDSADINAECLSLFLGKWHDVNPSHLEHADGQRHAIAEHDITDDESISVMSDSRNASIDVDRKSATNHPLSPSSADNKRYQRVPETVNPDEILLTYASLRSGAPLASTTSPSVSMSSSMALTQSHGEDVGGTTSVNKPSGMVAGAALQRLVPVATATAVATPTTATASSSGAPAPSHDSPAAHAIRSQNRSRSGSLSSMLSTLSPTPASPVSPPSSNRHPLSTSHVPDDSTTPHQEKTVFFPAPAEPERSIELSFLQRENLLIRNELNFELYLKEQHLRHIGRLHRDKVTDTALEAERQNLYHTVRSLRGQIGALTTTLDRQRAETTTTKVRHVQWEAELNNKLKAYREERKAWSNEARQLKAQVEENAAVISSLTKQLEESGSQLFELQTKVESDEPKLAKIEQYETKISQLTTCLAYWDGDVLKYDRQRREMEKLLNRWDEMAYLVEATESSLAETESKCARLDSERQRLERELQAAAERVESLTQDKKQLTLERVPNRSSVQALSDVEAERSELRRINETLSATISDLKARLESQQVHPQTMAAIDEPSISGQANADISPVLLAASAIQNTDVAKED